jgi:hypothetical protein
MTFIALFILSVIAIPVSFEIYYKGNDNILSRAATEIAQKIMRFEGDRIPKLKDAILSLVVFTLIGVTVFFALMSILSWAIGLIFW